MCGPGTCRCNRDCEDTGIEAQPQQESCEGTHTGAKKELALMDAAVLLAVLVNDKSDGEKTGGKYEPAGQDYEELGKNEQGLHK